MADLRWGLLGASRVARRWLMPALRDEPGHVAVAVAARDGARARAYAAEFGLERAYEGYARLIDDPQIDVVYIGLPNDQHLPWTLRALEAGKHVLCEKPLAMDAGEVEQMLQAEARCGRVVLEGLAYRFHPQIDRLRQVIADGGLGRLVSLQVAFSFTMPPEDFRWTPALGGGALYDIGCYAVNIMRLAAGREARRVKAVAEMRGGVDASIAATLDFGEGLSGNLACSFVGARHQSFLAIGSTGVARLRLPFSALGQRAVLELNGSEEEFPPCDPARAMIADLAGAIHGGSLRWPLTDSLAQARTLDALRASAQE
jgi:predicted dehydrogenase